MRSYSIRRPRHEIHPEEVLLDSMANRNPFGPARLESPLNKLYIAVSFGGMILFFVGMLGIVLYNQSTKQEYFSRQASENSLRSVLLQAPRGIITDRYGEVLADNKAVYDIVLVSEELPKEKDARGQEAKLFAATMGTNSDEIARQIEQATRTNGIVALRAINTDQALVFRAREAEFPGMKLIGKYERVYPYGEALSHVVGYVGSRASDGQATGKTITENSMTGKTGIEAQYDEALRGKTGELLYQINAQQNVVADQQTQYSEQGDTVQLTIDAALQKKIYDTLLPLTKKYGGGAVGIALDPANGSVLALASVPGFDSEAMSAGLTQKQYDALIQSNQKPFFNRAITGLYSPGSTIKPFIALAALDENIIDPEQKVDASLGYISVPNPYDPSRPFIYRDWKPQGFVNMKEAIGNSSDVYFYTIGGGYGSIKGLGVERITAYLKKFFWGEKTGIDLGGENQGFLPTAQWKEQNRNDIWRVGDTYNYSIGQGYVLTTPINLALTHAAIANGGTVWKPYLVSLITDPLTRLTVRKTNPQALGTFAASSGAFDIVRQGMRLTVTNGSARSMADLPFAVAGKTGSVQTSASLVNTNALFIAFMPYENPKISLLILVESGGGGSATAVPAAREILAWYSQNRLLPNGQ